MNTSLADSAAPASNDVLRSKQVTPLPIGPGGSNPIKREMNDTNVRLTMMTAQATADTKYDPPVPKPVTKQVFKEAFCSSSNSNFLPPAIFVIGGIMLVYGLVAK